MSERLKGKRIVITGAVANIGLEAVKAFAAEGARVVIGDRDKAAGAKVAVSLGDQVRFLEVDVPTKRASPIGSRAASNGSEGSTSWCRTRASSILETSSSSTSIGGIRFSR
jgi:NAD(P)-dependent dehydrogenase (short-subunit alcohol dehydrogenase family)